VLKMMEHVIVGFVFFLGFWNELKHCEICVHFLNKVPLSLHLQILCSRLGAPSFLFRFS
jgi:hypothetical protein